LTGWRGRIHLLREVRARSLELAFTRSQLSGHSETAVADAMAVFLNARNAVSPYADTLEGLERLSRRFPLMAVSNGNADIAQTSLGQFFSASTSAADAGCAKPHPQIFTLAVERLELRPDQVMHIGDHPEQDMLGAMDAGLKSMWMTRNGAVWPHARVPDLQAHSLIRAAELLNV